MSFRQNIIKSAKQMTAANPDNIGWMTIDDTVIDFFLMQGEDIFEYLSKDDFGNQSVTGSVYLDQYCSADCTSRYNIVHGHNSHLGGAL